MSGLDPRKLKVALELISCLIMRDLGFNENKKIITLNLDINSTLRVIQWPNFGARVVMAAGGELLKIQQFDCLEQAAEDSRALTMLP